MATSGHEAQKANDQPSMNLEDCLPPLSNHFGGPSQHTYILDKTATLPTPMKKRVEEKVEEIQSNFPINSLCSELLVSNMDVSRTKIHLDTSISETSNSEQREYVKKMTKTSIEGTKSSNRGRRTCPVVTFSNKFASAWQEITNCPSGRGQNEDMAYQLQS
ncbi:uncharacterized protein LOC119314716 [Triticum dicoccoides]|uniref:uncharacterized protein LOC119314716 n=1 Tax=Triticum dicoccoides TaxID=85692 RepID=UPI0018918545|nr:uncharacterized protein LOC119314716 [Triticum dicoccoides]